MGDIARSTGAGSSENIDELAKALAKAQESFKHAKRDEENPFFRSKYADLAAVMDACRKALCANGLTVAQSTGVVDGKLYMFTHLMHVSGQFITGVYPITPMKEKKEVGWVESNDPQSIGSAITYARRYALAAMVGVATEDDDAEAASGRGAAAPPQKAPQAPAGTPPLVHPKAGSVPGVPEKPGAKGDISDDDKRKALIDFAALYCGANGVRMEAAIIDWSKFHSKDKKSGEYLFNQDGSPKMTYKSDVKTLGGKWLHVTYENGKHWAEEYLKKHPPAADDQEIPADLFPEV